MRGPRVCVWVGALVLLASCGGGGGGGGAGAGGGDGGGGGSSSPTTGTVQGLVTAAPSRQVGGATVTCGGVSGTTGSDGRYQLPSVPAGNQTITASATGYQNYSGTVTVAAGATATHDIALTATPTKGTVSGKVTYGTNVPVTGVVVTCQGVTATSGIDGGYQLPNVPAGSAPITAQAYQFLDYSGSVTVTAGGMTTSDISLTALSQTWKLGGYAVGPAAANESSGQSMSEVVRLSEGSYRMYYGILVQNRAYIKYAESPDAANWTVKGTVLTGDSNQTDSEFDLSGPSILKLPDGRWRMYYQAAPAMQNNQEPKYHVASAISSDGGLTFTKEGPTIQISSVDPASPVEFAGHGTYYLAADGTYVGLVSARYTGEVGPSPLVLVTSTDGRTWTGFTRLYAQWHDPIVVRGDTGYRLYCTYLTDHAGTALSPDGLTWPTSPETVTMLDGNGSVINEGNANLADYGAVVLATGKVRLFATYAPNFPTNNIIYLDQQPAGGRQR